MDDQWDSAEPEQSLDDLSKAFAQAMDRNRTRPDPAESAPADEETPADGDDDAADVLDEDELEELEAAEGACPISPQTVMESILFVGHPQNEPITAEAVASLLRGVEEDEIQQVVDELNESYAQQGWPLQVVQESGGFRLALHPSHDHLRERFYGRVKQAKLSRQAIDVLAVVAYHQPVTREKVDKLVGASCSRVLNQLIRRDLLDRKNPAAEGRKSTSTEKKDTKQPVYRTTARFLELFNLSEIGDLPRSEEPQ